MLINAYQWTHAAGKVTTGASCVGTAVLGHQDPDSHEEIVQSCLKWVHIYLLKILLVIPPANVAAHANSFFLYLC